MKTRIELRKRLIVIRSRWCRHGDDETVRGKPNAPNFPIRRGCCRCRRHRMTAMTPLNSMTPRCFRRPRKRTHERSRKADNLDRCLRSEAGRLCSQLYHSLHCKAAKVLQEKTRWIERRASNIICLLVSSSPSSLSLMTGKISKKISARLLSINLIQ